MKVFASFSLTVLCLVCLSLPSHAVGNVPNWVQTYFSGTATQSQDYEGIAFLDIKGKTPSAYEIEQVEKSAQAALVRQLESNVHAETSSIVSETNGIVFDAAQQKTAAQSHLKVRIDSSVRWFDERQKRLWAKVTIPRRTVEDWIHKADSLYAPVKVTKEHGIIYRHSHDEIWIKLEDGRKVFFKTKEALSTIDRVIVTFHGNDANEVYYNNKKLHGTFIQKSGR